MNNNRLIYYAGFPIVVISLCVFSYYLGLSRGRQLAVPELAEVEEVQTPAVETPGVPTPIEGGGDLTFFKKLQEDSPAEDLGPSAAPSTKPGSVSAEVAAQRGSVVIQVSAFKDVGRAHELIDLLKNQGFPAFARAGRSGAAEFHRVFVGPYRTRDEGEAASAKLAKVGYSKTFLTNLSNQ